MNAHIEMIELVRQQNAIADLVNQLKALSSENDTIVEASFTWIKLIFVGRGTEQFALDLGSQYSVNTRLRYINETIERLKKIKGYILECAA